LSCLEPQLNTLLKCYVDGIDCFAGGGGAHGGDVAIGVDVVMMMILRIDHACVMIIDDTNDDDQIDHDRSDR
jgi:uncharacterized protein (DUF362 family)